MQKGTVTIMETIEKTQRLMILTKRAISLGKELLIEKENLVKAVAENLKNEQLKMVQEKIATLARKERLYLGALESLLDV